MSLDSKQRRALKARAHGLKPVVRIGQKGLTEAVRFETDAALTAHELIKVAIAGDDRKQRASIAAELAGDLGADLVGTIGKIAILYRPKPAGD